MQAPHRLEPAHQLMSRRLWFTSVPSVDLRPPWRFGYTTEINYILVTTLCESGRLIAYRWLSDNPEPPIGVHSGILGWRYLTAKRVSVENSLAANIAETVKTTCFARFGASAIAWLSTGCSQQVARTTVVNPCSWLIANHNVEQRKGDIIKSLISSIL